MNTFIKFCGITRREDAIAALRMGANAIGFVFYEASPRVVSIIQAQDIINGLNPLLMKVGLFVNADPDYVHEVIEGVGLNLLQFHGNESAQECEFYERPYIKAIKVSTAEDVAIAINEYPTAQGLLLDTPSDAAHGGTGESFDWSLVPKTSTMPLILAGGLNPDNVTQAIQTVRPDAVDVSSGIESEPGIKDPEQMAKFIIRAKKALISQHTPEPIH